MQLGQPYPAVFFIFSIVAGCGQACYNLTETNIKIGRMVRYE